MFPGSLSKSFATFTCSSKIGFSFTELLLGPAMYPYRRFRFQAFGSPGLGVHVPCQARGVLEVYWICLGVESVLVSHYTGLSSFSSFWIIPSLCKIHQKAVLFLHEALTLCCCLVHSTLRPTVITWTSAAGACAAASAWRAAARHVARAPTVRCFDAALRGCAGAVKRAGGKRSRVAGGRDGWTVWTW